MKKSTIVFPSANDPRPIRLREETRAWAKESLNGKYGDEAVSYNAVSLDGVENFENLTPLEKYDSAIRKIAENAPLRFCPEERLSGAATLGMAIGHIVPATRFGKFVFGSVSHLTIDYEKMLKIGMDGYEREIDEGLNSAQGKKREVLQSMKNTVESMRIWHARYIEALQAGKGGKHAKEILKVLSKVPFSPAGSFYEAVQAIWFEFAFTRLAGYWPGIGRLDLLLGKYLERDLKEGRLTESDAREILASFFIKGCEWIRSDAPRGSGDAQHYQNIVLAGTNERGRYEANRATYLILEIVEELPISDFPITVRLSEKTPKKLFEKMSKVIRHGGGVVALYNENTVINGMLKDGYSLAEARRFANDGCWEVQVPGATNFVYMPFDGLQIFNRAIGLTGETVPNFSSTEEIFKAFAAELKKDMQVLYQNVVGDAYERIDGEWRCRGDILPTTVIDLFENGCIERGRQYYDLGTRYTVRSPHIGGAPDVANSLLAIEKLVFEKKLLSFDELIALLRGNWEQNEALRLFAKNKITYYGNDDDEADGYMKRVVDIFCECVEEIAKAHADCPVKFIPGISTFGRQIEWLPSRCATAFGAKKGEILSANDSPTPGTDFSGATAIIRSYCKTNPARATCGAALDLKIFPSALKGENGLLALESILRAVVELGGFFVQIDTVDKETLLNARLHPENYKTLSVRVSGWNARFVTLNEEWQNMIIERTSQGL